MLIVMRVRKAKVLYLLNFKIFRLAKCGAEFSLKLLSLGVLNKLKWGVEVFKNLQSVTPLPIGAKECITAYDNETMIPVRNKIHFQSHASVP